MKKQISILVIGTIIIGVFLVFNNSLKNNNVDISIESQVALTPTTTGDKTKPTTPPKPTMTHSTSIGTTISWKPSTDNVGVKGYNVFRNNIKIATVVEPKYIDTTLKINTSYSFKVSAYDAAGNTSANSQSVSFKITQPYVPPIVDTTPPTVVTLSAKNGTSLSGTFVVEADVKDAGGISKVKILRDDNILLGEFTTTSSPYRVYVEPSQIGLGIHTFKVEATDTAGNKTDSPSTITATAPIVSNGVFSTIFGGVAGNSYNVLRRTGFTATTPWEIVATRVAGIDGTIPYSEPLSSTMAFYKIEQATSTPPVVPPLSNGLVAYWDFDNVTGTVAPDISGNNRSANMVNNPIITTGAKGSSMQWNETSQSYANANSIPSQTQFSVSTWINPRISQSAWGSVVMKQNYYGLEVQGGRIFANIGNGSGWTNTISAPLSPGVWYHVVQTYNGTTNTLYIDGIQVASGLGALTTPGTGLLLGSWNGSGEYFDGKIDEVRIYNRALLSTEVSTLFNSIIPPNPSVTPTATLTANPSSITTGASSTLTWSSTNATSCMGVGGTFAGSKGPSGSAPVSPSVTTTYSITCGGTGGNSNVVNAIVTVGAVVSTSNWYVDGTLTTGLNNGTSWANAWRSFDNVVWGTNGVKAGNILYISGGNTSKTYSNKYITVGASGTASAPIKIRPGQDVGHDGMVIFDYSGGGTNNNAEYAVDQRNQNYIIWDGEYGGVSHIKFQNLRNILARHVGRTFYNFGGDNHTYRYITFNNMNNGISEGVRLAEYNRFELMAGDYSINATHNSVQSFDQIIIRHNFMESAWNNAVPPGSGGNWTGPDGVWADTGVTVHNNIFKSTKVNYYTSDQHTDYLQSTGNYIKVYNNEFVNIGDSAFDYGVYANTPSSPHDVWIYNNLFRTTDLLDPYPEYFRFYGYGSVVAGLSNFKIFNNTFADSTGYMMMRFDTFNGNPTASGVEIKNNIFQNIDSTIINVANSSGFNSSSFSFGNNLYSPSSSGGIEYRGSSYTIPTWISGVDILSKSATPAFTNYTAMSVNNDFHLLGTDTGAQNSGENLSSYCSTAGGSQLCKDRDGNARSTSGAWDIGAYEYVGSVSTATCEAVAGNKCWYIDNAVAVAGTGTSWATAFKSFAGINWSAIGDGDFIYISGGSTDKIYNERLTLPEGGTASYPLTVRPGQDTGHNGVVTFDGASIRTSQSYVTINGNYNGQRHILIMNNAAVDVSSANHPIVKYVEVKDTDIAIGASNGIGGEFAFNYLHGVNSESAIRLNARNMPSTVYGLTSIHDNEIQVNSDVNFSGTGPDGLQLGDSMDIFNNEIYGAVGPVYGAQHQDLIQTGGRDFLRIYNNTFENPGDSMLDVASVGSGINDIAIFNNLFKSTRKSGTIAIRFYGGDGTDMEHLRNVYIIGNTFVDVAMQTQVAGGYGRAMRFTSCGTTVPIVPVQNVNIQNNIIYNMSSPGQSVVATTRSNESCIGSFSTTTGWNISNNNINAGAHGGSGITMNETPYSQTNGQTGAPSFVSYAEYSSNNNLKLNTGSTSTIGKGENLTSLCTLLGSSLCKNKDGVARPTSGAWDIGAY